MAATVLTTANTRDRSFIQARGSRNKLRTDKPLLLWRRMIEFATAEAKKTEDGMPTDLAILARWWIADFQPKEADKQEWERSFACACNWLDLDAGKERKKRLHAIDLYLQATWLEHMRCVVYTRRAMVLSCAGVPSAIAKQFVLPLVAACSYDDIAGVETMDFFPDDLDESDGNERA